MRGLGMNRFKRREGILLPRFQQVLGLLAEHQPRTLLDIGSGRGSFLWPLLDAFPSLAVTAIDRDAQRVNDLLDVRRAGFARLSAAQMDATRLGFADRAFEGVTLLEVLEHLDDPLEA